MAEPKVMQLTSRRPRSEKSAGRWSGPSPSSGGMLIYLCLGSQAKAKKLEILEGE